MWEFLFGIQPPWWSQIAAVAVGGLITLGVTRASDKYRTGVEQDDRWVSEVQELTAQIAGASAALINEAHTCNALYRVNEETRKKGSGRTYPLAGLKERLQPGLATIAAAALRLEIMSADDVGRAAYTLLEVWSRFDITADEDQMRVTTTAVDLSAFRMTQEARALSAKRSERAVKRNLPRKRPRLRLPGRSKP